MSSADDTTTAAPPAGNRLRGRWSVVLWLWLLWTVLWGSVSPVVLVCGAAVAVAVAVLFPLPPIGHRASVHPLGLAAMAGNMLVDLVRSALVVAREAVLRGPRTRAAVLEVHLEADTDLLITATSHLVTLTPGTLVLEIDRGRRRLYVHALPVRDASQAPQWRTATLEDQRRVVRALGTAEARERLLPGDGRAKGVRR
ncbi:Na+/H+ antiporter subunit E [Streptomyces verrucosisporus]|uniref:Na+/H+ antiporter subunit E n=1 Tax=Streptomyces verrucosisporus TaxID=1695161 RepID=UPI0019D0B4E4|nr:Na+/H+ antiporter subunit E [Streptomyces verrucosisporus]MBN3929749.1 Na+/H+ antiporter subunit E [Streptomyces verrucosisporus]